MKYLIFGTGDYYERYKKWFDRQDILALLDNSQKKQNTIIDGIDVLSPQEGIKLPYDIVVILSFYVEAMRSQLLKLGVPQDRIYHFYDLHSMILLDRVKKPIQYYGNSENIILHSKRDGKKILLMSQELTLGGPAIALFHSAVALSKHGYKVVVASMIDGPLRDKLLSAGIPVVVDTNLQIETMDNNDWVKNFSLIFCNTINFHVFLSKRNVDVPVIWWLHDAPFFYDGVKKKVLQELDRTNLKMLSVGPIPKSAFNKFVPDADIDMLLYGVRDYSGHERFVRGNHEKIYLATIGFLEDIKGQDLLIKAIQLLPESIRGNVECWLVGHDQTLFAQNVKEMSASMPQIKFIGSVNREKIHQILDEVDILVCPSRQDSMPTVAAEAMMHSVPCIVSDATGTAAYIRDGENGFVFRNEDIKELSYKIKWCVQNREKLYELGSQSRKIYEEYFSMNVFESNLLSIVDNMLSNFGEVDT